DQGLLEDEEFVLLDASKYSFPGAGYSETVTISKGEKRDSIMMTVKPDQFGFDANYALPLKISSASSGVVSGNFGHMIYAVIPNNQWAGDWTNTFSGPLGAGTNTVTLSTTGEFTTSSSL